MRIFLDTNVLVSAFATRGLCADVLRVVLSEHELITSEDVLAEFQRVLEKKLSVPIRTVSEILTMLRGHHVEPTPSGYIRAGLRDQADEQILAGAISSGSDILVTGDNDLLDFSGRVEGVRILSPRGFWEVIGQGKSG